jgi:glucose-1-phosphate adenylyltransferase
VRNSILGRGVRVHTGAFVEGCVIMDNCDIGRHAKVRRAILDKNVRVPEGAQIGYDLDADRARGWHVTDSGIVVIGGERSTVPVASLIV